MKTETRAIEIRLAEDPSRNGPGLLQGVLIPYERRAADRAEMFKAGALHWPEGGVVLREQHNRQAPIVRFVPKVDGSEVRASIPLPDTTRGRDAALLVRMAHCGACPWSSSRRKKAMFPESGKSRGRY